MKKKFINILIMNLAGAFILVGCLGQEDTKVKYKLLNEFPYKYVCDNGRLKFETEIVVSSDEEALYRSTASITDLSHEENISFLLQDKIDCKSIHIEGNNYLKEDGQSLYIEKNYISYNSNSELFENISKKFSLFPEQFTADKYIAVENVEELLRNTQKTKIEELLLALGIKNNNLYKYYIIDEQYMQSDRDCNELKFEYKENSSDSYYWLGEQRWQDIPVFCSSFYAGMIDAWAPIQILYINEDVEKLQILYCFDFEKSSDKIELVEFDEIAKSLEKRYAQILTDNNYIVKKAELSFWVDVNQEETSYAMLPIWIVSIREYKSRELDEYIEFQELVNAETAVILEVGE